MESPVDCDLGPGERCYIQHYVDRDPSSARRDYQCRAQLTYDGHGGTDYALRSLAEMQAGVRVLAAAPGTVRAVRDGIDDVVFDPDRDAERLAGRDCGNGVVIDHAGGWQTQYCHLRKGTVSVQEGMPVRAGDPLGQIGMSGRAQFPHLHLHVRKDRVAVDPFAPNPGAICGDSRQSLFRDTPPYHPGGLIAAGFSAAIPAYDEIKAGLAHQPSMTLSSPAVVLWGFAYGSVAGDVLRLSILSDAGEPIYTTDAVLDRSQAQLFRAGGRRTNGASWFKPGTYTGTVTLLRGGAPIEDMRTTLTVTSR